MSRFAIRIVISALLLNSAGCLAVTTPRFMMPAPERAWKPTLEQAQKFAAAGQVAQADSTLASYATSYPGTAGARESLYWRSLIQLQSAPVSSMTPSAMLGMYLNDPAAEHPVEAATLYRITSRVDSLSRAAGVLATKVEISTGEVVSATSKAADAKADAKAATAETKDQEAEIKRLKNELAAAKDELERIKKRLAEPPKKPPVK
jgi:hypothetical protein